MGWKHEPQFRFHYTADGHSEMSWQPTSVHTPDKQESSISPDTSRKEDAGDVFLFFSCAIVATLAYQYVSHIDHVRHLPALPRSGVMGVTIVTSFLGSMAFLPSKAIQTFAKTSVAGLGVVYFLYL